MTISKRDSIRERLASVSQDSLEQGISVLSRVAGFCHRLDRDEEQELYEIIRLEMDEVFNRRVA